MPQPIEDVISCDDCPLKIAGEGDDSVYYCGYGTVDVNASEAPDDCRLRDGYVIVRLKVRR